MIISKEKIIYNKILENTNSEVLKVLHENSLTKLFVKRITEVLDDPNEQYAYRDFPFTINSFTWAATPEGSNYWIDAHMKIDRKARNVKRLFIKDIIKEIGYENS